MQDWKSSWAALYAQVKPLVQSGAIVGWFLGDELFPGKISIANFTSALGTLAETKKEFPDLLIWENEGGTGWLGKLSVATSSLPSPYAPMHHSLLVGRCSSRSCTRSAIVGSVV
jgi:hypothetical protein